MAFNWNRIFTPSLVNEVLVGYNQVAIVNHTLDWNGIGNANATFGIAGGQPIAGLSSIGLGGGLTSIGGGASDSDTLDRTYQINEKLIWLKGRHSMKFGGQLLHYVQRRFYAGNNGLLGLFGYGGAFSLFPFSDFLLDQVSSKGRGSQAEAWTHLHNRMALYVQDDFKVMPALTLNLGMRWAYTEPIVEKDDRQSNFDLSNWPADSSERRQSRESRALQSLQERLRAAPWVRLPSRRSLGRAGRLRHHPVHGGNGSQPAAAAESTVLLRIGCSVRRDDRRGNAGHGLCGTEAARSAVGTGTRVGSEPAAAAHAAVERLRRIPPRAFHVSQYGIRRS